MVVVGKPVGFGCKWGFDNKFIRNDSNQNPTSLSDLYCYSGCFQISLLLVSRIAIVGKQVGLGYKWGFHNKFIRNDSNQNPTSLGD